MPTIFKNKKINYPKNEFNNDLQKLYNTRMWKKLRLYYLKNHPLCEECLKIDMIIPAREVHHKKEISSGKNIDEMLEILLDEKILESVCIFHHHQIHNKFTNY